MGGEPRTAGPLDGSTGGDPVRLLAPLTPDAYVAERRRIMDDMKRAMVAASERPPTQRTIDKRLDKELRSKGRRAHTLPERLVDALSLDTADYQDRKWRPPARRPRGRLRSRPGSRPECRRPATRPTAPVPDRTRSADRRPFPAGRPPPAPYRGHGPDWRADAPRGRSRSFGWQHDETAGRRIPEGAERDFGPQRRWQTAEGPVAHARVLAAGRRGWRRLDRPCVRVHRWRHEQ